MSPASYAVDSPGGSGSDTFEAAVAIGTDVYDPARCTGVLLQGDKLLTAKHCVLERELLISTGPEPASAVAKVRAVVTAAHRERDLAVLTLAQGLQTANVTLSAAAREKPVKGTRGWLVGYGGAQRQRRSIAIEVIESDDAHITVAPLHGSGACFGDSGAPLFLRSADGAPYLAGILSAGSRDCAGPDVCERIDEDALTGQGWLGFSH